MKDKIITDKYGSEIGRIEDAPSYSDLGAEEPWKAYPMIVGAIIGVIAGACEGFSSAGVGGAIVGIFIGAFLGAMLANLLVFVFLPLALIVGGIALVVKIISLLWDLGMP